MQFRHTHEIEQLREELEHHKELLVTYEQAIARKDHIIANLTKGLQKQVITYDLPTCVYVVSCLLVYLTQN